MQRRKNIDVMKTQWPKTACRSFFFTPVVTTCKSSFITLPNDFNDFCALENYLYVHEDTTKYVTSFDCTCQRTKFHPLAEFEINLPIQNEAKLYNQEGDLECV